MSKTREMLNQEEMVKTTGKALMYVSDQGLRDGERVVGIMFDCTKRFWLVER